MNPLSQLAETLIGSEIVRLGNQISERIRAGEKIYNYTIGDFDPDIFPIPQQLEENIINAYKNGYTNYPAGEGILELRQAVSQFINEFEGLQYDVTEIQIASGGRPLIYSLFRTIVNPGDKVIYAVPSWNNNHYVHLSGGEHCKIEAYPQTNFMPTALDIAPHVRGAVLLCLCTPQNPTGTTLNRHELEKICDLVLEENMRRGPNERKLYVLFDQIYFTLTYGETQHYNPVTLRPQMRDYTIFIDGISKAFAATGVRVGWALGPAYIISKMKALLSHIGAWAPMAEQKATAQFLLQTDSIKSYMHTFKNGLEERLQRIYNGFRLLKEKGFPVDAISPQAAIYLTVKIDLAGRNINGEILQNQEDVTYFLLAEAKLAIVPFYAFGADPQSPWYRLSVGTIPLEEIDEMLGMLESALRRLE
ncbi:MAG: pyridoxal phosphate-dependent aminotransferase [Bacteroidia bacterium]